MEDYYEDILTLKILVQFLFLSICYGLAKTSCSFDIIYLIILIYSLNNKVIIILMIKLDIFIVKFCVYCYV
jgi:hypothetical protein